MDRRMSRSMPMLVAPFYFTPFTQRGRWPERRPRHFYVGGVRTQLIGADSYPNPSHSPRRLILCGSSGSYQKMTRSSSTAELSRTGVYCSREDLRPKKAQRRATSCEDVFRVSQTTKWDSREGLSESGVSLNDSRTDLGSCVGLEDVDGASQCSFGSSSAFHEITCDSEMDRPDSDCLSVPSSGYGHDRSRDFLGHDSESRARRSGGGGGGGGRKEKTRHDSGSREKFLAELTASSGRSSPREDREFYHSTPTKRGSPVLSIFPADDEDLHFPSHSPKDSFQDSLNQRSADSLLSPLSPPSGSTSPTPPRTKDKKKKKTSPDSISSSEDTVKEALRRRRQQFFSSLQDCSRLGEEQSPGVSVQSWLTTGHPQHHDILSPLTINTDQDAADLQDQPQEPPSLSPLSPPQERISVRDRVRAIEQGPQVPGQSDKTPTNNSQISKQGSRLQASSCSGEDDERRSGAGLTWQPPLSAKEGGGAERVSSHHPHPSSSPGAETASLLQTAPGPPRRAATQGITNQVSPTGAARAADLPGVRGVNGQAFSADKNPTYLSSSSHFGDHLSEKQPQPGGERRRVSGESGTVPGGEEDNSSSTRLQIINGGSGIIPGGQVPGTNYGAVSNDDRSANTGADHAIANTAQPLLSAGLVSVDGNQDSVSAVFDDIITDLITQNDYTTATGLDSGNEDEGGDAYRSGDVSYVDNINSEKDREFARLVSGFSDTDSWAGDALEDGVSGQGTSLYHARPIRIVSPDEQTVEQRDSLSSGDRVGDRDDAEVQSVLAHVSTQPQYEDFATDMDPRYQALLRGLSPDHSAHPGVATTCDVSRHHTRHVHRTRTTVEETVTTRHTVRHNGGSPTCMYEGERVTEDSSWLGPRGDRDYEVTDRTVSKVTVTEQDSEKEETTTRNTRVPQSQADPGSSKKTTDYSFTSLPHTSTESHTTHQRFDRSTEEDDCRITARHGREQSNGSHHILDRLRERLSVLSADYASFDSEDQGSGPSFGYKDHAEASLPQTDPPEGCSASDSSGVIRGTGSVFFTLDRSGSSRTPGSDIPVSGMTENSGVDWETDGLLGQGSGTPESGHDASLYHARAVRFVPNGERVLSPYSEGSASSSQPTDASSWGLTGSSSQINDSDDRCTPNSIPDSSHSRLYSDSGSESRPEEDTSGHTFQDFLSGLQDQFTSDRPTLHRSMDTMAEDFPSHLFRASCIQETILEADDERDSTDEEVPLSPTIHSFKSSLHFCVPESTPANIMSVSSVSQMQQQSMDRMEVTTSEAVSSAHPLQNLRDKLSSLSDMSYDLDSHSREDADLSLSRQSDLGSPTPSAISGRSVYSTSASAEVQKMLELDTVHALTQPTTARTLTSRRLTSTHKGPRKTQWVQEKVLLFQKLLNDLEWQGKTSEQKLMEEMVAMDCGHDRGEGGSALERQKEVYDDLYNQYTREYLENRQNHVCPVIEDHMPAIRFRRFLRKKHNSKVKGHKTVRVRHQMEQLAETSQKKDSDVKPSVSDVAPTKTTTPPYHIHPQHRTLSSKLRGRFVSDVFTDDADINRSIGSDSAYSSLSGTSSSRDLDSTFRSFCDSRADVSSTANDVSIEEEKMRLQSDVFDHLELYEGDVDEARLDQLQVGHTKAGTR